MLWALAIFLASSLESTELPSFDIPYLDKLVHLIEFFILAMLTSRLLFKKHYKALKSSQLLIIIITSIFGTLYGLTDEIHQLSTEGRVFSLVDLSMDAIGSVLGSIVYFYKFFRE